MGKKEFRILDKLTDKLAKSPYLTSKAVADKLGINKRKLIELYQTIIDSPLRQKDVIKRAKSNYPGFMSELKLKPKDWERLSIITRGDFAYPKILELHLGKTCPSNCIFCYNTGIHYKGTRDERPVLSKSRIRKLVKKFYNNGDGGSELWISGGQEPFVHPATANIVEFAAQLGLKVHLFTNGIVMDPERDFDKILNAERIRFSINGATRATYQKVHRVDEFDSVLDKVRALVAKKTEKDSNCRIGISFIFMPQNYRELTRMVKLAHDIGANHFFAVRFFPDQQGTRHAPLRLVKKFDDKQARKIMDMVQMIKDREKRGEFEGMEIEIPGVSPRILKGGLYEMEDLEVEFCRARAIKLGVSPFGDAFYCEYAEHPQNEKPELVIGDLSKENLRAVVRRGMSLEYDGRFCPRCLYHEKNLNLILEKLIKDHEFGIDLEKQPLIERVNGIN